MNISIVLILICIVRLASSSKNNNTGVDSCDVCTISFFRRKRANAEYTRWGANAETKQEFIVKILEDDISTPEPRQIAAVNIQPITKAQENIIIRGAFVPPTRESTLDLLKEYTRFVPPTTPAVARIDKSLLLTPVKPIVNDVPPVRPHGTEMKYGHVQISQRDHSPQVNPGIINEPKSQTLIARQYAPIAPVSFTRRNSIGPLTPRTVDTFILRKTTARPTRTSTSSMLFPIRTSESVNFIPFARSSELFNNFFVMRTSTLTTIDLHRTTLAEGTSVNEESLRKFNLDNKIQSMDKESDTSYNDLSYNDDYNESTTKKRQQSSLENYEETQSHDEYNKLESDFISKENVSKLDESQNSTNNEHSYFNYAYEDDIGNTTVIRTNGRNSNSVTTTQVSTVQKQNFNCTLLKLRQLSFSTPLTLNEIVKQLKKWAEESPVAKWLDVTKNNYTVMENPIYMMIVDDPSSGQIVTAKQTVMVIAGIQGRDHHAVTAAMYLLYQLIERSETHSDLLTKFRFWIIPVFNPDGYDYSMTFPHRREWLKNLRQSWDSCKGRDTCKACEEYGIRCTIQPCYGVNLDRNFEYQWIPAEELQSEHPCGALYAGPRQLSEAETHALTHFLHDQRSPLYTFIAFKEGDVLGVMYPYSHTRKRRAFDHVYRLRASQAASAAYSISGRPYVAGQTSEFLPLYAGGIEDWVDGHLGIDNTYTVMMFRPTDSQNSKLAMERVVHEAFAAVDTLLLQNAEPLGPPAITLTRANGARSRTPSMFQNLLVILIIQGYG